MAKNILDSVSLHPTRRQMLLAAAGAAGAGLLRLPIARAATVSFEYMCDKASGFLPNPNEHKRVGYVTQLSGFGIKSPLAADLQVSIPTLATTAYTGIQSTPAGAGHPTATAKVVGVLEKFSWGGGVGDAIELDFWTSQQNAVQLKTAQQSTLTTTRVDSLGWWIVDYDQETKKSFEAAYPQTSPTVSGLVGPKDNPVLNVDLSGAPAKDGIDVMVYKVTLKVVPAANKAYALHFANSSVVQVAKNWGLVVGSLAAGATGH